MVKTSRRNLADMPVALTSPRAIGSLVIVKTIAAALRVKRIEAFETDRGSVIPVGTSTDRRSLERTHGGDSRRAIEHPWCSISALFNCHSSKFNAGFDEVDDVAGSRESEPLPLRVNARAALTTPP
jgi:hypothetical protein